MSFHGSLKIRLARRRTAFVDLIGVLSGGEWSLDNGHGYISFCVADEAGDLFDWEGRPVGERAEVMRVLGEAEAAGKGFAVQMTAAEDRETAVNFMFFPGDDGIHVSVGAGRRVLEGLGAWLDLNWYVRKTVGPLVAAGWVVEGVETVQWP